MTTKQRPYAVFDIDGTLIRWQLFHALVSVLAKRGLIDIEEFNAVLATKMNWKNRSSANSFEVYEQALIDLLDNSLKNISYQLYLEACNDVVKRYQEQVYTYTRDLLLYLKQQHYLIFAISGSPEELVKQVASYYKFDDYGATKNAVKKGRFTGDKTLATGNNKLTILKQLIEKHNATNNGSIGIGDSIGDIPLLKFVERPIAFNPASELFAKASKESWEVVIERKNMVYKLQYENGRYVLATPDSRQSPI